MMLAKGSGTSDIERVFAASEAIGKDGQLLLDSLGAYKIHEAREVGARLDELPNIGWWEDALLPEDIGGYAEVKRRLREELLDLLARRESLGSDGEIRALEALLPRGVIFHGPPGTG